MTRIFIVHRWTATPFNDWYPWLKNCLEENHFKVFVPSMPNTKEPKIDEWINHLSEIVCDCDENTFFIGHGIGCQTILRYLEVLDSNIKVGGVIMIAPWLHLNEDYFEEEKSKDIAKPWLDTPIDFNKVKMHTNKFVAVFSNNDPYVLSSESVIFEKKLKLKIIVRRDKGHFTEDDDIKESRVALKQFLNMLD